MDIVWAEHSPVFNMYKSSKYSSTGVSTDFPDPPKIKTLLPISAALWPSRASGPSPLTNDAIHVFVADNKKSYQQSDNTFGS